MRTELSSSIPLTKHKSSHIVKLTKLNLREGAAHLNPYLEIMDQINQAFEKFKAIVLHETAQVEQLKNFHLTPQQEVILFYIIRHQPVTAQEIALHFHISKSAVSQVLPKLLDQQLIVRQTNPHNRREAFLRLGDRGQEYAAILTEIDALLVEKYYSKVPLNELQQVLRIFTQITESNQPAIKQPKEENENEISKNPKNRK